MKTILIDPSRCIQCCNCQNACKDEHCDNDWRPLAASQGQGQFWIKVHESQAASGTRMRLNRVPIICQHCERPACMEKAPEAVYRREDGLIIIDPEKARGLRGLVEACPYGVVFWNEALGLPQKCTGCAHLLDEGWEKPRCVNACPTDALRYVDESELIERNLYAPLERLHPEFGTAPRVAYVNLPKPFVAGSVYSPTENRCLEKVDLTLTGQVSGKVYRARTELLGEFRISGIEPGIYRLKAEIDGYDTKVIECLDVREALNVGDIRLMRSC